jgi:hypothetical protein
MEQALAPPFVVEDQERSHVDKVRRSKKGKVTGYHHVVFGWVKPQSLYFLEKLHQLWPGTVATTNKLMEGGYRFKEAVVSTAPAVFGFSLPLGVGLYSWAGINTYNNLKDANDLNNKASLVVRLGRGHWDVSGRVWINPVADVATLQALADHLHQVSQQHIIEALKWAAAMALPYCDLWLIYKAIEDAAQSTAGLGKFINDLYTGLSTGDLKALASSEFDILHLLGLA